MSLNWREINAIIAEAPLHGAVLTDAVQPDFESLLLIFQSPPDSADDVMRLRISHRHGACALHLSSRGGKRMHRPPRFVELLRARLVGGRVQSILQVADQRIVRIAIDVPPDGTRYLLWIRLWSGAANTILTDAGLQIIDAYYRRPQHGETSGEPLVSARGMAVISPSLPPSPVDALAAPYPAVIRPYPPDVSFNAFIDTHYRGAHPGDRDGGAHREMLARVTELLAARKRKIEHTLTQQSPAALQERAALARQRGELLVRHTTAARQSGQYAPGAEQITIAPATSPIPLDSKLNIQENAQKYFRHYRTLQESAVHAGARTQVLQKELEDIEQRQRTLAQYSFHQLKALYKTLDPGTAGTAGGGGGAALRKTGTSGAGTSGAGGSAGVLFHSQGHTIVVGRSATENDALFRHYAKPHDMWMHARNREGSSVFIRPRARNKPIALSVLYDGATLAHYYSKARRDDFVDVHYTEVKHLRRSKDKRPGAFVPIRDRSLQLKFDPARLRRLQTPPAPPGNTPSRASTG